MPSVSSLKGRQAVAAIIRRRVCGTSLILAVLFTVGPAWSHGIVGNRFFPGTMAFDDPAVSDELTLAHARRKRPADASDVVDSDMQWSLMRLLTPTVGVGISSGWLHRSATGFPFQSGFEQTALSLKGLLYKNEIHEIMVSSSLSWGIGGSGAQGVGANIPHTITPGIFVGKGFGDLPDAFGWLRPFAVTAAVTADVPLSSTAVNSTADMVANRWVPALSSFTETLHWGFSVQYSTYYLTPRFTGRLPKEEPLYQLVPLVEFAFDSRRQQKTRAAVNPGLAYVADVWQISAEAIVPLNRETGRAVGVRMQLLLFLDDFAPALFGKPLLRP